MSSKAITAATTHYLQFDIQWSSLALLYYDYALTFPMEVRYIWGQKFRLSTVLYIFCRYALLANLLYLLAIANRLQSGCTASYRIISALSILGRTAVIVTFTKRTYAIFSQNKYVLAYLSLIGATAIGLDIAHVPGVRCVGSSKNPTADLLLSILMVVFEASSAFLTIVRCVQAFRVGGIKRHQGGLIHMIFEQGVLYFSIISLFTTAAVILNVEAPAGFFQRLLNAYTLPLSCLLTARFLLHLRAYEEKNSPATSSAVQKNNPEKVGAIGSFRAAARDVVSTIVEPFGEDPVRTTRRQNSTPSDDQMNTVGASSGSEDDIHGGIAMVHRKSKEADHSSSSV